MFVKIKSFKERYKSYFAILEIILFPLLMIFLDILIKTILNMGGYLGTFLRGMFEYFV